MLDSQNHSVSRNVLNQVHLACVIDSYDSHVLLIQNDFVNRREVENLLDKAVVLGFVLNVRFNVPHVDVGVSATARLLNLVGNQIGCQLFEP